MSARLLLLTGLLAGGLLAGGCDSNSPAPTTPTPQPTPPPAAAPPPPPPAPEPAALASIAINPSTVNSQGTPEATIMLTAAAPSGNAVVRIDSGNPAVARVPENVSIAAGQTSNTFRIETSTVSVTSTVTITATYAGVSRQATLTVQPPALEPRFTVTSPSRGEDACDIINALGAVDCQFNASSSAGFVGRYQWTIRVGDNQTTFTASDNEPVVTPGTNCGFLGGATQDSGRIRMEVSLLLEDRSGNRSGTTRREVTIHHNGRCGY